MRRTRLFEVERERGWTRRQLAERVGYGYVYLCQIKSGNRPITPNFEMRCAYALGIPREFLFYDSGGGDSQPELRAGSGPSPPPAPARETRSTRRNAC